MYGPSFAAKALQRIKIGETKSLSGEMFEWKKSVKFLGD
jgi:predicted DNA-binding protein